MKHFFTFDIETGPLPDDQIAEMLGEISAPANWKDPQKIADYIRDKKADAYDRAALSDATGRVLAIGVQDQEGHFSAFCDDDESKLLGKWWAFVASWAGASRWVGFNCFGFDRPFLIARSWANGIAPVPAWVELGRWDVEMVDLLERYKLGSNQRSINLDRLAKMLGVGGKNGSGAEFANLWKSDKKAALEYLENDVAITRLCAERMRVFGDSTVSYQL